jgi:hypothetical protein
MNPIKATFKIQILFENNDSNLLKGKECNSSASIKPTKPEYNTGKLKAK